MITKLKLPFNFDVEKLKADLEKVPAENWLFHHVSNNYVGKWNVVQLRSVNGRTDVPFSNLIMENDEYKDTEILESLPYIRDVIDSFKCPKMGVRLMSLAPNSCIKKHTDNGLGYENKEVRIHVPITTNEDLFFEMGGERIRMGEGECWYADFNLDHSVDNRGTSARVHLVIDCEVNEWFDAIFKEAGFGEEEANGILFDGQVGDGDIDSALMNLKSIEDEACQILIKELEKRKEKL